MKIDLPYLVKDRDRYDTVRYYVRRKGQKKTRIQFDPKFLDAHNAALDSIIPKPPGRDQDGSRRATDIRMAGREILHGMRGLYRAGAEIALGPALLHRELPWRTARARWRRSAPRLSG